MAQSALLVERLKQELKARGITYRDVATAIGLSEASVKRLFSRHDFTLARLDAICALVDLELTDLARGVDPDDRLLGVLSEAQETALVSDPLVFIAATATLNLVSFDQILAHYTITAAQLVKALTRLDKLGFLRLLPNNRYRLLVARTFHWLPDGPIQRYFKANAAAYFDSAFDGPHEFMVLLNARLSRAHAAALVERLERVAKDFSEQHVDDARLPPAQREPLSLLLAVRPWELGYMRELKHQEPTATRKIRVRR